MNVPLLEVDAVEAGYDDVRVLHACSLEVRAGEFIALVGPNGAGKSTLLKTITGLLPVSGGAIRLDGERIDGLPPYAIAGRGVALIVVVLYLPGGLSGLLTRNPHGAA